MPTNQHAANATLARRLVTYLTDLKEKSIVFWFDGSVNKMPITRLYTGTLKAMQKQKQYALTYLPTFASNILLRIPTAKLYSYLYQEGDGFNIKRDNLTAFQRIYTPVTIQQKKEELSEHPVYLKLELPDQKTLLQYKNSYIFTNKSNQPLQLFYINGQGTAINKNQNIDNLAQCKEDLTAIEGLADSRFSLQQCAKKITTNRFAVALNHIKKDKTLPEINVGKRVALTVLSFPARLMKTLSFPIISAALVVSNTIGLIADTTSDLLRGLQKGAEKITGKISSALNAMGFFRSKKNNSHHTTTNKIISKTNLYRVSSQDDKQTPLLSDSLSSKNRNSNTVSLSDINTISENSSSQFVTLDAQEQIGDKIAELKTKFLEANRTSCGINNATIESKGKTKLSPAKSSDKPYPNFHWSEKYGSAWATYSETWNDSKVRLKSKIVAIKKELNPLTTLPNLLKSPEKQQELKLILQNMNTQGIAINKESLEKYVTPNAEVNKLLLQEYKKTMRQEYAGYDFPNDKLIELAMDQIDELARSLNGKNPILTVFSALDASYTEAIMLYAKSKGIRCEDHSRYGLQTADISEEKIQAFNQILNDRKNNFTSSHRPAGSR